MATDRGHGELDNCNDNQIAVTEEEHRERGVDKCAECRHRKIKCSPSIRVWNEDFHQKCKGCQKGNRECGPNERKKAEDYMQDAVTNLELRSNGNYVGRPRINAALKRLDCNKEALCQLDLDITYLTQFQGPGEPIASHLPNHEDQSFLDKLNKMYRDILQTQLIELAELVSLADGAAEAAATDLAEKTYCRVLCHFQNLGRMDFIASDITTDHCKLLIKVAEFYLRNDEEFQAEKHLIEAVKLPAPQPFLDKIWQLLRDSLPRSSESLAALAKEKDTGQFLSPVTPEPFPPGHRVMRSGYASTAPPDLLWGNSCRDITSSPPIHAAIQANVNAVFEMIEACPEHELFARDAQSRTPLFLAALLKEEFVACSIIARLSEDHADYLPIAMNDRDYCGEPILNAAIRSGCCVRFIQMLLQYGAEVEPEVLLQGQLTPLQAAAQRGDFDVVSLLISNGAMTNRVCSEEMTALQIAQKRGNTRIAHFLESQPHVASQ